MIELGPSKDLEEVQEQLSIWEDVLVGSEDVTLVNKEGQTITVTALLNLLSKAGNLGGLTAPGTALTNLGATPLGKTLLGATDPPAARAALAAQQLSDVLTALSKTSNKANTIPLLNGTDTTESLVISALVKTLLSKSSEAEIRALLGAAGLSGNQLFDSDVSGKSLTIAGAASLAKVGTQDLQVGSNGALVNSAADYVANASNARRVGGIWEKINNALPSSILNLTGTVLQLIRSAAGETNPQTSVGRVYTTFDKPTAVEVGAVPVWPGVYTSDLNDIQTEGDFKIAGTQGNWPFPGSGGLLSVRLLAGGQYLEQTARSSSLNAIKYRLLVAGAWRNWVTLIDSQGGALDGPLSAKTINGQGASIGWSSIDVGGSKGGYAGINFTDVGHWFGVRADGASGVWGADGTSKWFFNENRELTGGAKVPWDIVTGRASRTNWADKATLDVVSGQLCWNYYGNGHTVFDASLGLAPGGTAIDRHNAQIPWRGDNANYPTLMGWNGVDTYGVRVDSARQADAAVSASSSLRLDGDIIKTKGQDISIWDKRAMVGVNDANQLVINYANDWGLTVIGGEVHTGPLKSTRVTVDTQSVVGTGNSYNSWRHADAPFHAGHGGLNAGSFAPIVGSANYTNGYGFTTRIHFGAITPGADGWTSAAIMVGSAESDTHPLAAFVFGADGSFRGVSNQYIDNNMTCNYAYALGAQPLVPHALTRKDFVDAQLSAYRWNNLQLPNHNDGNANSHYNSAWDGANVVNAPSTEWHFFRELYHSGGSNWRHQEAFAFFSDEEYFRRGFHFDEEGPWRRRWHSGNFDALTAFVWRGRTDGDLNSFDNNGAFEWTPNSTNVPVGNTYGNGFTISKGRFGDDSWSMQFGYAHGHGFYLRQMVNGGNGVWERVLTDANVYWTGSANTVSIVLPDGLYAITAYVGDGGDYNGTFMIEVSRDTSTIHKSTTYTPYSTAYVIYNSSTNVVSHSVSGANLYKIRRVY